MLGAESGRMFASSMLLPMWSGRRSQDNKTIKCKRAAALLADEERINVDRLDDVTQIARQPAKIDQRLAQRIIVSGLAAAKSIEQPPGARFSHHVQRLLAAEGSGREADILEQLDPDASQAEHHDRSHLDIAL